jgi:uncharacterized membrane protein
MLLEAVTRVKRLLSYFVTGLVVVTPTATAFFMVRYLFVAFEGHALRLVRPLVGKTFPGLAALMTLALIYALGIVASDVGGRKVVVWYNGLLERLPIVRPIYSTVRLMIEGVSKPDHSAFSKVVLVQWPGPDSLTLGYLVSEDVAACSAAIYVPKAPSYLEGFTVIAPSGTYRDVAMSLEDAARFIVSYGALVPPAARQGGTA